MSRIFISYRRDDTRGYARSLYGTLTQYFSKDKIFMDIDTIEYGVDFAEQINRAVGSCDALVAIIGKQWLVTEDATGKRRIDNRDDFVRLEIETALKRNVRVIPCLVDGAEMPQSELLPKSLKKLVRLQALKVNDATEGSHFDQVIPSLENALGKAAARRDRIREKKQRLIKRGLVSCGTAGFIIAMIGAVVPGDGPGKSWLIDELVSNFGTDPFLTTMGTIAFFIALMLGPLFLWPDDSE